MNIKTFRARTLRDALAMVRSEFGPGAAVLHTREVNTGPLGRVLRGPTIEVAATPDHSPLAEQAERTGAVATAPPVFVKKHQQPATPPVVSRLVAAGFTPDLARELVTASPDAPSTALRDRFSVGGPIKVVPGHRRVVALVGPTGVGKTTTLAKLAANFRLLEQIRVGLVTVDTYRVAAVDQLRTYAEIIDLPMEVVSTPDDMRAAVAKLAACELVLIDTAGRSPRDRESLTKLSELLAEASPDETHLVLSATATAAGLRESVDRFGAVRPTSLLLTKLDEASALGHAAAPVVDAGLPISYLTDGQNVPEDIRVAESTSLARGFVGEGLF